MKILSIKALERISKTPKGNRELQVPMKRVFGTRKVVSLLKGRANGDLEYLRSKIKITVPFKKVIVILPTSMNLENSPISTDEEYDYLMELIMSGISMNGELLEGLHQVLSKYDYIISLT